MMVVRMSVNRQHTRTRCFMEGEGIERNTSIDSVIGDIVPANIRASSRGKTEGASVIHNKKASKG